MNISILWEDLTKLPYYTKQNLGLILNKEGAILDYWINKLIREEMLIPLKKGLYVSSSYLALVKAGRETETYLEFLSGIVRYPSYLSLEYVLAANGLIPETVFSLTSITLKTTRAYPSPLITFTYRNLQPKLFTGFIEKKFQKQTFNIATPAKALFDYLYLRKMGSRTEIERYLLSGARFNWDILTKNDRQEFANFVTLSGSKKMASILQILKVNHLAWTDFTKEI